MTTWNVAGLAVGQTQALTFTYPGSSAVGTHMFMAVVDSACQVTESNEANNTLPGPLFAGYQFYFPMVAR